MKKYVLIIATTVGAMFMSQKATAQWGLFGDLLNQTDDTLLDQFFNNLNGLDTTWSVDQVFGNELLEELYLDLEDPMPSGMLDSSFIFGLDAGLDTLAGHLSGFGLSGMDEDTLLGEGNHLLDIFSENFDSLGGLFGQYQDSLSFDSANWNVTVIGFDGLTDENLDVLQDTLGLISGNLSPQGPGNLAGLMDQLFDQAAFPDLELAFGVQSADLKYWDDRYSAEAKVIRLGSVPRFQNNAPGCHDGIPRLPIEARWHVQASWINGRIPSATNDLGFHQGTDDNRFNPLLLRGDFAVMATPYLGRWGNTSFRLITSLGMEFGTYAPAHREYNPPFTTYNKGYATGFGPQVGGGFAMTTGQLTIYSTATVAQGDVVRCALPYRFNSQQYEVGMRFGNVVNVRYSTGRTSWQDHGNRQANVKHQLTVGIILQSLHH